MDSTTLIVTFLAFATIAIVYSGAGFGGGSSYLAVLAMTMPGDIDAVRTLALACNLVVVGGSVPRYRAAGLYDARRVWPLILSSVPAAAAGASMRLSPSIFFPLLGGTLIAAGLAMTIRRPAEPTRSQLAAREVRGFAVPVSMGGGIGLLSGLVGIGGGIFLSPVLHLIRWDESRRVAAVAALFILVNSAAGLVGRIASDQWAIADRRLWWLLPVVAAGGQLGCRWSIGQTGRRWIRGLTATLVIAAGARILVTALG